MTIVVSTPPYILLKSQASEVSCSWSEQFFKQQQLDIYSVQRYHVARILLPETPRVRVDMHVLSTRTTIRPFSLVRLYVPGNMSLNYSSCICNLRHQSIFTRLILVRSVCIRDTASNVLRGTYCCMCVAACIGRLHNTNIAML